MYLGSYSFPNKEQFIQALRNFGQASLGYFFSLALKTMAPEIGATLDVINELASRMNQFMGNSCQMASQMVNGLAPAMAQAFGHDASGYASAIGSYVDKFDGYFGVKNDFAKTMELKYQQVYNKTMADVKQQDIQEKGPGPEFNIVRYALQKAPASTPLTEDEKDLIMSLIGPEFIVRGTKKNAEGADEPNIEATGMSATIDIKKLIGNNAAGSTEVLKIRTCLNETCTEIGESSQTVTPFSTRAHQVIDKIQNAVESRQAPELSTQEEAVIKLSSVPLYRAAAMSVGSGMGAYIANSMLDDLADYAAIDAGLAFVDHYLNLFDRGFQSAMASLPTNVQPMGDRIQARVKEMRNQAREMARLYYANKGNPYTRLDMLDRAERASYSNLNRMLAANARFAHRH